jgi:uncharacterized protein YbjT (DUF2867 family)
MRIVVTGSLGNISRKLVEQLVSNNLEVKVISSNPNKATEIEALKAIPAIGSVEDPAFVREAFQGADAVYTMVPPDFTVPDYNAFTANVTANYANAIQANGIRYVVNLSSAGSALAGVPPLTAYANLEDQLDRLAGVHVLHLRPAMFYTNFYGSIPLIKYQGIMGHNIGAQVNMVMSHPHDIAEAAADALGALSFKGRNILYIVSDQQTGEEAAALLGQAINKPELRWVEFTDEQLLAGLLQNGFSEHAAQTYVVAMGRAIREGLIDRHYQHLTYPVFGKRTFSDFAKEFKAAYAHS